MMARYTHRADGFRCYLVLDEGSVIGRVYKRDDGRWNWSTNRGGAGGCCYSRKEATQNVVRINTASVTKEDS